MLEKALSGSKRYWSWVGLLVVLIAVGAAFYAKQFLIGTHGVEEVQFFDRRHSESLLLAQEIIEPGRACLLSADADKIRATRLAGQHQPPMSSVVVPNTIHYARLSLVAISRLRKFALDITGHLAHRLSSTT